MTLNRLCESSRIAFSFRALLSLMLVATYLVATPSESFAVAQVASVQNGTLTSNGNGIQSVTISAVDPNKAFLMFSSRHDLARPTVHVRGRIASATSIEFERVSNETAPVVIEWSVVEYATGVRVQRGEVTQAATANNVTLPTAVTPSQSFVLFSKTVSAGDTNYGNNDPVLAEITSPTNLQIRVSSDFVDHIISWEVVEFLDAADINVQTGSITTMGTTNSFVTATLTSPVDLTKAFVLAGYNTTSSGETVGEKLLRTSLQDASTVRVERSATGDNISEIFYQVVELTDGSIVQSGTEAFTAGSGTSNVAITPVDLSRSVAFASTQSGTGGQNQGEGSFLTADITGVSSYTLDLTAASNLEIQRTATDGTSEVSWFVADFGLRDLPIDTGNVADWTFDEGTGPTVADGSGNGRDGTVAGATFTPGVTRGSALEFDGVDDAATTGQSFLNNLGAFTISVWVNPQAIGARQGFVGQNDAIEFGFDAAAELGLWTASGGAVGTPYPFGLNEWHHIAAVGTGLEVQLYGDGVLLASTPLSTFDYGSSAFDVNIGGGGIWDAAGNFFDGELDEIRIFDRALTPTEIASLATRADVAVAKVVDNASPNENDTITYTVRTLNNGPDNATGLEITDLLPAGVTFVSSVATQGSYDSGTGVWTLGSVAAAQGDTLTITATVDAGTAGSTILNTAFCSAADQADPVPANNTDDASLTVVGVDIAITKVVDEPSPLEGATINYTVAASNAGPDPATGVEVTDVLPAGVTFVSSTATQGSYDSGTGVWALGTLAAAGTDTLTITATVDFGTGGSNIDNTATLTATSPNDTNAANDSDSATISVGAADADLAVTKTVDNATPDEGATIQYEVIVSNLGPASAGSVAVTDSLPAGVTFVSAAATQGSYDDVSGVWTVGSVAVSAADTLTITVTVDPGTAGSTILNTATVTGSDRPDGNAANDSDSASITVTAVDLAVTKVADDDMPMEGQTVVFTIDVTNAGPDTATGVSVSDLLPAGVTFVSVIATQGSYVDSTGAWTVGTVTDSTTATLAITVTVDAGTAGTTIVNTASVSAVDQADTNVANDSDSASLMVQAVDVAVSKTVDDAAPDEGQTITYTVIAASVGADAASGVEVTDLLPAGVTFVSASATQGTYVDSTGLWTVGVLGVGEADTLSIDVTVDLGTAGSSIDNTATLTAINEVDVNPANDSATAGITVNDAADVAVTKSADVTTPIEGTAVTFEVVASNVGTIGVTGLDVSDLLPSGLTHLSSSATNGTYTPGTGLWTIGALASSSSDTLTIVANVDDGTAGMTLTNTAVIAALDQTDSNAANDTSSVNVAVRTIVSKTITSGPFVDQRPSWAPDGSQIAFDSDRTGNQDVWKINVASLVETQLTTIGLFDQHPDWSPTTGVIAYAAAQVAAGPLDIWTIPENGGVPTTLLADSTAFDRFPSYSRDGTQIAYSKDGDIYVAPAGGGVPVQVTTNINNDTHPTWSADGSQIAFLSNRAGNNDVWIIPSTGGVAVQLTTDPGNDGAPDWSPDGRLIAFQSNRTGDNDIWVVSPQGGPPVMIVSEGGQESQPDWSADGTRIAYQADGDIHVAFFVSGDDADIRITKVADATQVNEGQTVTYTVTATNVGPNAATNVVVSDVLPAGVTFSSAVASQGSYVDSTGLWSVGSIGASGSATLDISVTVDAATGGSSITNTASLSSLDQNDPLSNNDSDSATIDVLSADIALAKTVDLSMADVGDTLTYTLEVVNNGPATATNVVVADPLPAGLAFVTSSATSGSYNDVTGDWSVGSMTNAQVDTLLLSAQVVAGAVGSITNVASATLDQADPNLADNADSVDVNVSVAMQMEEQITSNADNEQRPTWSPDGLTIAFDSNESGNRDIYTVPRTGGAATQITTSNRFDQHPDWSPDGTQFAYISPVSGTNDIVVIPAGGGAETVVEPDSLTNDRFPNWSPDGTMIAYTKDADIYVIPAGGGVPVQITTDPASDAHPSWSPDGSMIVFLSNRSGNNDLWWIPSTGGVATQITTDPANDGAPDWSPDGTTIAFQSNRATGDNDIWTIAFTGGPATQITSGTAIDVQPAWSPDAQEIAFARDGDIWVVTLGTAGSADVSVAKTVDDPNPAEGATIVYEIVTANAGPDVATGVKVSDLLPAGVTFVSSAATQGFYDSGTGLWSVGVLASGAADTLFITAAVDSGTDGQTIVNVAALAGIGQNDPSLANNSDSASILVNTVVSAGGPLSQLAFQLKPMRPNPFRGATSVQFDLPRAERVQLSIYDVSGRLVRTLVQRPMTAGQHEARWDGRDSSGRVVAPGVYFVKIRTTRDDASQKVVRIQ